MDSYGRPRIEANATFVLEPTDPVLGPCGYVDCLSGTNTFEIIEVFSGAGGLGSASVVTLPRAITEVSTECACYSLIGMYTCVGGGTSLTSTPTDNQPSGGWDPDYSFTGSTSANPIYNQTWMQWVQMEQAAAGGTFSATLSYLAAYSRRVIIAPIPSGTVFQANGLIGEDEQFDIVLVKGGRVGTPNLITQTPGGASGHSGSGVLSYSGGSDWNGVMGNGANTLQIAWALAQRGKAANCGANFGTEPDGDLPSFTMEQADLAHSGKSNNGTKWQLLGTCQSSSVLIETSGRMAMSDNPAASVESGLAGVRPGYGAECGWASFLGATCGPPTKPGLEGGQIYPVAP